MNETDSPLRLLRVEASPQALNRLSPGPEGQQSAVAEFLKRLNETLHEIDSNKDSNPSKNFLSTRKSRLQFWSGEPGIGKTSAYLSARQWFVDQTNYSKDEVEDNLRDQLDMIRPHANRICWLESLDLEPLSGRPNFLASVAVRIDKALDLGPPDDPDSHDAWMSSGTSDLRETLADFRRLKNEIALSWEGNLTSRGGGLDPDVYASEVIRAENARLDVSLRFRETITQLARRTSGPRNKYKSLIFILPIDDFYIQPRLSLEILRLLRMISCAHLFVLMLGDMDHLEELSFGHSLGEFSDLLGNNGANFLDEDRKSRICRVIENRTAASLHKLIPANQIFRFLPMRAQDTLKYRPQPGGRMFKECLKSFLDGILDPKLKTFDLYKMIKFDKIDDAPWCVIYALEMTPRNASDLYQAIAKLEQRRTAPQERTEDLEKQQQERQRHEKNEILKLISEQIERALFESLSHNIADSIWRNMSANWDSFYQRQFPANTLRLEVVNIRTEKPVSGESTEPEIIRMYVKNSENVRNSEIEIPPRARGWLAVLYYTIRCYDPKSAEISELDRCKWKESHSQGEANTPVNDRPVAPGEGKNDIA